ncbi:ABC-2 type transport system ATP-binding protein [Arthrobacter woluwensis]|uniref:ABC transporter ATP-binding protein n=1 Tax=Arthrobacter woluwensis TaxID=156980 RepID=UPI00277FADA9|nr:ATP-binding cassette domain-containing protein [Arthrobacter woluwensis]MDQ0710355.1 ABC-2 type transport system ATP-binding protein [Arthrobacter woluwensis]
MIQAQGLRKQYGPKTAVSGISFTVQPGRVTGFLGPNGAGKSTTMRMIMGLDKPTAGHVTVNGKPFAQHKAPLREVGALLDAKAVHTGRSAYNHLRAMAATHDIPLSRVHEVMAMTGLTEVAKKRAGGFSLGMGQRLGIANALLGDPQTLILDEPVNGLDPEGVHWVRNLVRYLAGQGKTVFLSSHLMSEMAQTADHLLVIGRGQILADMSVQELIAGVQQKKALVRTPQSAELAAALAAPGVSVSQSAHETLEVSGLDTRDIARAALERQILLYELTPQEASLEQAYFELTRGAAEYQSDFSMANATHAHAAAAGPADGQGFGN